MEMKNQIVTEEDLIAFISEGIEPFKPEEPAETSASSWVKTDEDVIWHPDLVTEEAIARENGCWVDEDGHWQPIEYDDNWF